MIEFTPELLKLKQALNDLPITRENEWAFVSALEPFEKLLNAGFTTDAAAYIAYGYAYMRQPDAMEQEEILNILNLRYMIRNEFRTIAQDRIAMGNGTIFKIK